MTIYMYCSLSNRYVANYSYSATRGDELSFISGDIMQVTCKHDDGWWDARLLRTGKEGEVPNNYVIEFKLLDEQQ